MKPPVVRSTLAAAQVLDFERSGHTSTRKLLTGAEVAALSREVDQLFVEREVEALRQKVRVLLGDERLARAEISARSGAPAVTRALRRVLRDEVPEGS